MTDCTHPKCHENMRLELEGKAMHDDIDAIKTCLIAKVPKKTLWVVCWAVFVVIAIPLFVTGINVWSQQEADFLRYAQKEDVVKIQVVIEHLSKKVEEMKQDIKEGQTKAEKDREEMLRLLRKR